MAKDSFPIYDICNLQTDQQYRTDILVENFSVYLKKNYHNLHFPHRHSFYHVVYFSKGVGHHTIDFKKYPLCPGQIYFMIPGQVHGWYFTDADGYIINFSDAYFKNFLANADYLDKFSFFSGNSDEGVCNLPQSLVREVSTIFEKLLNYNRQAEIIYSDLTKLTLLQLFNIIESNVNTDKNVQAPQQNLLLLKNFRKMIDANYKYLKLPKDYAEMLYITPHHLNAICKNLVGKTAGDLIRDRVLLESKRLLVSVKMSIAEIAYELNFQDNSYFNRFFKKNTGITPQEFRKQMNTPF